MSHINWDTLQGFKSYHNGVHNLLKRYHEDQNVTEQDLIKYLENLKSYFAEDITNWKQYLGHED